MHHFGYTSIRPILVRFDFWANDLRRSAYVPWIASLVVLPTPTFQTITVRCQQQTFLPGFNSPFLLRYPAYHRKLPPPQVFKPFCLFLMATAFLRRPSGPPLRLNPRYPDRGYLSVVQSWSHNNGISLEFQCKLIGPEHDPLWEVVPISKSSVLRRRRQLALISPSVMGEVHNNFRVCHMKKQYAKNQCAHLIADSGHCVRDASVDLRQHLLINLFRSFVVRRLP